MENVIQMVFGTSFKIYLIYIFVSLNIVFIIEGIIGRTENFLCKSVNTTNQYLEDIESDNTWEYMRDIFL